MAHVLLKWGTSIISVLTLMPGLMHKASRPALLSNFTVGVPQELWQAASHFDFFEQRGDISDAESILSWFHQTGSEKPQSDSYLASHTNSNLFRPFLKIDLTAPDSILLASFKRWLTKERKLISRQRIQKFTKITLRRWAANQVLPYIDLT